MFKPLLAAKAELDKLTFPMIASPKIDGIRCLIDPEKGAVSRTMKPIPNNAVRAYLNDNDLLFGELDGEIVTYTDGKIDDFNTVQSKVMRADGLPDFKFHVFDDFSYPNMPYVERLGFLARDERFDRASLELVPTETVTDLSHLAEIESHYIDVLGWEGVMIRRPDSIYKFGRSTVNEGVLLKVKRFEDDEAEIIGTIERMHNGNEATKDAFGRTERSSHKANMVPTDTLGALSVHWKGIDFEIGTGFDDAQRAGLWAIRDDLIGQTVTFKYQGVGSLGAPRFPVFLGMRYDLAAVA